MMPAILFAALGLAAPSAEKALPAAEVEALKQLYSGLHKGSCTQGWDGKDGDPCDWHRDNGARILKCADGHVQTIGLETCGITVGHASCLG